MDSIKIILLILLNIYAFFWLVLIIKKEKQFTLTLWSYIWIMVYYCIIPLVVLSISIFDQKFDFIFKNLIIKHDYYIDEFTIFIVFIFITIFNIIVFPKDYNFKLKEKHLKYKNSMVSAIKIFAIVSFLLSIISFFLYVKVQGGIFAAIENAQNPKFIKLDNATSILKRFIPFAVYPLLLLFHFKKKYIKLLLFITATIILVSYSLLERQRQVMLFFILIPMFGFFIKNRIFISKKFFVYSMIIIVVFPIIHFLNKAHNYDKNSFKTYKNDITINKYINEFNFPYISLYLSQHMPYDKLLFADFWTGVFGNYLPSAWVEDSRPANSLNSFFFLQKKSRDVPPGIIANSYYHLGIFGVIFFAFILGIIINFTDTIISGLVNYNRRYAYLYSFFFWPFFAYIRTGILGFSLYVPLFLFLFLAILASFYFNFKN